jgi:hypothetical protein
MDGDPRIASLVAAQVAQQVEVQMAAFRELQVGSEATVTIAAEFSPRLPSFTQLKARPQQQLRLLHLHLLLEGFRVEYPRR